jgi:hypothetical protein
MFNNRFSQQSIIFSFKFIVSNYLNLNLAANSSFNLDALQHRTVVQRPYGRALILR